MSSSQIVPIFLFFLSIIIAIIGFFLRSNWEEIKKTNNQILLKIEAITISFAKMEVNSDVFRKDIDKCTQETLTLKKIVDNLTERLQKLELMSYNKKSP